MGKVLFLLLILLLILPLASGFGVTPAQRIFDYQPGTEQRYSFEIVNSEHKNVRLTIIPQGELNESVVLSNPSVLLTPDIPSVKIEYSVKVPEGLAPGRHIADILVVEDAQSSNSAQTYIGSIVGIITKVVIDVPYPGKYLESVLSISKEQNGDISFTIPLVSRGELEISKVSAKIDIFDSGGKKATSLSTDSITVPSLERKELHATLTTSELASGSYNAVAQITYDGKTIDVEKEFFVGGGGLAIKNIGVDTKGFSLGGVAKFEFLVENNLNFDSEDVYVLMQVLDNKGEVLSEFKSATYNIDPFASQLLVAFWDTEEIKKGTYDALAFINSQQEPIEAQLTLEVSENNIVVVGTGYVISSSSGGSSLVTILVIVIAVLVLLNLVWFLVLRKRIKKK